MHILFSYCKYHMLFSSFVFYLWFNIVLKKNDWPTLKIPHSIQTLFWSLMLSLFLDFIWVHEY